MSGARSYHAGFAAEEQVAQLQSEARLLAGQWTDPAQADALADAAGLATGHRVTLIDTAGVVLGDSEFDKPRIRTLENHRTRPEVRDALSRGTGSSRRMLKVHTTDEPVLLRSVEL